MASNIKYEYEKFNPVTFFKDYYSKHVVGHDILFKFLIDVYNNEKFLKGTSFLDLGSGPTIHWLAAPSRKYSDITLSELVECNLVELKKWWKNDRDALQWTEPYKWAAAAENISDHNVIIERLRNAVKDVIPCDVLQENPLLNITKQFDVVQCTFAVDSAAQDNSSLKSIIKNVSNIVKPGGALVMFNTLGATHWIVGEKSFPKMTLDKKLLEEALLEAGFEDLDIREIIRQGECQRPCDLKGFLLSTAFKKK